MLAPPAGFEKLLIACSRAQLLPHILALLLAPSIVCLHCSLHLAWLAPLTGLLIACWTLHFLIKSLRSRAVSAGGFARLAGFNGGRHLFELCLLPDQTDTR